MERRDTQRFTHTWDHHNAVVPRLICASYNERTVLSREHHCRNPFWVFDYSVSTCGRSRVGRADAPWRERGPHVGHLYPPATNYWEDFRTTPVICSAWGIVQTDPGGHLRGCIPPGAPYARFDDPDAILQPLLLEAAKAGAEQGEAGFWRAQGAFLRIFDYLRHAIRLGGEDLRIVPPKANAPPSFVRQVHALFEQHLAERITLNRLAKELHVSPSTLSHRYARETGTTPISALITRRIERTRELLLRGLRLGAIAEQTGFHDAFHLSKTFKKHTGMSPREYVKHINTAL